jgi:SAM-dependent methyltransferase
LPSEADLKQLYNEDLFTSPGRKEYYIDDQSSAKLNALKSMKLLHRHRSRPGQLLDLGCGFGHFMAVARDVFKYDVTGCELSDYAAQTAKNRYNLDIMISSVQDASFQHAFDVVTLWDVIEHLRDPFSILVELTKHLNDDGIVVLSTGDRSSLAARLFGNHWSLLNPLQHLYYFNESSLDLALQKAGFKIKAVYKPGRVYPVRYIGQKLKENFKLLSFAGSAMQRLSPESFRLPVNFRDIMVVVAEKNKYCLTENVL